MKRVRKRLSQFMAVLLAASSLIQPVQAAVLPGNWNVERVEPKKEVKPGSRKFLDGLIVSGDDSDARLATPSVAKPAKPEKEDEPELDRPSKGKPLPVRPQKPSTIKPSKPSRATPSQALYESEDPAEEEDISVMSLLPLQEEDARLILNGYTEEELKAMPVDTVLSLLEKPNGDPIDIDPNAEKAWFRFINKNDWQENPEVLYAINSNNKVDMSSDYAGTRNYDLEIIVGNGKQLDPDNIQYNVEVYITGYLEERLDFTVYDENGAYISSEEKSYMEADPSGNENVSTKAIFVTNKYQEGKNYLLNITSRIASERSDIQVDVYPLKKFEECNGDWTKLEGEITHQILNQTYGNGYPGTYMSGDMSGDNVFAIVYKDAKTGDVLGYENIKFTIQSEDILSEEIFAYENGQMTDAIEKYDPYKGNGALYEYIWIGPEDQRQPVEGGDNNSRFSQHKLKAGYEINNAGSTPLYYVMKPNQHIKKVILDYDTNQAKDITAQVLPADKNQMPYGYPIEHGYLDMMIVFDDGFLLPYYVSLEEQSTTGYYDDAPPRGRDPYFYVKGATGYNSNEIFIVENSYSEILDTCYGIGYQTLFIMNESADLSDIKIIFGPDDVDVNSGGKQVSGETSKDFSGGRVSYQAHIGENPVKNYEVAVVKKESGPKLFVNGPLEGEGKREVFLDEYFENRHDILIANIGDQELTGLKVELLNAVNVKLDDYWVVGGNGNDTLAPFESVYRGSMKNLAKIRLLPDGEGDVIGTLKISAHGQDPVFIELTGHAGNPRITTEALDDAVKYVPYSFMVATNNMHDWNKVTFSMSGTLPEGLTFNRVNGEIYGVPKEFGEFPITVRARYSRPEFTPSEKSFTLVVKENTNENVYLASDAGYSLKQHIGREVGTYDYMLESYSNQLFVSEGEIGEFIDYWLNGEKLVEGVDYTKESGSTRITVKSQTFATKTVDGTNTISAEFRVQGDTKKELKRTAQNFKVNKATISHGGGSGNSSGSGGGSSYSIPVNTTNQFYDNSWKKDETGWKYKLPDGSFIANTWYEIAFGNTKEWFYFNEQGYAITGWFQYNGNWYYLNLDADGYQGKMITGWKFIGDKWYYFSEKEDGPKGAMLFGSWFQLSYKETAEWYHFASEGHMETGWFEEKGRKYYLNPIADGTRGKMITGWKIIDGKWYYFNEESDGTKGVLLTNTKVGDYYVDKNGVWVK